tara:strand:+ start:228 stop:1046 length:819 start_codon:yes stop_codon:yes gene_type:complete
MCKAYPYPRCSHHAKERYQKALQSGDPARIKAARIAYHTTPAGIKELEENGRTELADRYRKRRAALIQKAQAQELANKKPLRLGLDLDETSAEFIIELRKDIARRKGLTEEEAAKLMPVPQHYSLVKSGWFKTVPEFLKAFNEAEENGIYLTMAAKKRSGHTLRKLVANKDVELHVVTAREQKWNEHTREWLRKRRYPIRSITHTERKEEQTHLDVFLDDSDQQILTLSNHGRTVIAFENHWNSHLPSEYRVKSWEELPAVIKNIRRQKNLD